jgi:hypothetical protein
MTTSHDNDATGDAMDKIVAAATQNARCAGDIAIAASHVIAKRVALGMAAAFDPTLHDHAEFARMVPEKVAAFSGASMVMLTQSRETSQHIAHVVSREVMTTARASVEMAGCRSPAALALAQGRFARAWFGRAASQWIALGIRAFEAQSAAMAPIRQTVVANAERLASLA